MSRQNKTSLLICLGLALATALAYCRVGSFEFTSYDDPDFVTNNAHTQAGLSAKTIGWAFHSEVARNWHPITMLTHALDCQLFGLRPGPPHVVNLLFHIADTLLLFLVLREMTGALWRSAAVAAFFALHPLHVESVAWIAERKDVLSAFFWLLTMWAYGRYARGKLKTWYAAALGFFAVGLMCKPMLVTLPFVLLLLDYWPLQRWKKPFGPLFLEKLPFLALSVVDSVITFSIQEHGGSVLGVNTFSLAARIENALMSYVRYLGKMVWPSDLAGLYLRHGAWAGWQVLVAVVVLIAVMVVVLLHARRRPFLLMGWFWYLGTLLPVIGLVQVGMQSMADRYTYLPLIGIFIMLAWGVDEFQINPRWLAAVTAALLGACACSTYRQTYYWRDSETLFQRMIAVTDRNYMAHYNLGNLYSREHRANDAIAEYQAALRDEPNYADAANNLGGIYLDEKRYDEALQQYVAAVRIVPDFMRYLNLGNCLANSASARRDPAQFAQAEAAYRQALALNPNSPDAHHNLGLTLSSDGKAAEALPEFEEAARLAPDDEASQFDVAEALSRANRMEEAAAHFEAVLRLNPHRAEAHSGLGLCDAMRGDMPGAAAELREAIRLQPENAAAYGNLGNALAAQDKFDEAETAYAAALKLNPNDCQSEFNFGLTLYRQGKNAEAKEALRAALRLKPDYNEARRALEQIP